MDAIKRGVIFLAAAFVLGLLVAFVLPRERPREAQDETLLIGVGDDVTGLLMEQILQRYQEDGPRGSVPGGGGRYGFLPVYGLLFQRRTVVPPDAGYRSRFLLQPHFHGDCQPERGIFHLQSGDYERRGAGLLDGAQRDQDHGHPHEAGASGPAGAGSSIPGSNVWRRSRPRRFCTPSGTGRWMEP